MSLTYNGVPKNFADADLTYDPVAKTVSGTPKAAGTYVITATANSLPAYNCGTETKTVTINVAKRDLTIEINDTKVYDGQPLVTNYNAGSPIVTAAALQNGATLTAGAVTTASGNVDTYSYTGTALPTTTDGMTITTPFATSDDITNYNVSYNITQEITALNAIVVTLHGNTNTAIYDGQSHTVTGYIVDNISSDLYTTADFGLATGVVASATRTNVVEDADADGKTYMGLTEDSFVNNNPNFASVQFEVTDGWQAITPKAPTPPASIRR